MKAMILAAGRGKRMGELTQCLPKPLLPICGKPLIEYHIEQLAAAGVQDIVINLAYLGEMIEAHLGDGRRWQVNIRYSREYDYPQPLETGGGIIKALPLLGDEPFLVLSADIWAEFEYKQWLRKPKHLMHLCLVENPDYHPNGDFALDEGYISLYGNTMFTYANLGIFSPKCFAFQDVGVLKLSSLIKSASQDRHVTGELYTGAWFNVGTPNELRLCEQYVSKHY